VSCSCTCRSAAQRRRPSAALVVATVALFLSLGGTSYAAVKAGSIGNRQLATDAVSASKIRANAVGASEITAGAVRGSELAGRSVTGSKIALDAVTSQLILDGSIGGQDIADGSLGTQQVANGSLGTQDLAPDVVSRLLRPATPSVAAAPVGQVLSTSTEAGASTALRGYSVPADGAGSVLLLGHAAVTSAPGTVVTCVLARGATTLASTTVSVAPAGQVAVPLQITTSVAQGDAVSLRCRADGPATVASGSALDALRVGP
jgi:hypothetical protein